MQLILIRHGIAEDRGNTDDDERALTPKGAERVRAAAEGLVALDVRPALIAASPLRRARETAHLLSETLPRSGAVLVVEALRPDTPFEHLQKWAGARREKCLLVVGHMPDLAEAASRWLSGRPDLRLEMKKSGAACLRFPAAPAAGAAELVWWLPPGILRAVRD